MGFQEDYMLKKIMMLLVASRPPERRPTGMLTAHANWFPLNEE